MKNKKYVPKELVASLSLAMSPVVAQYNSSRCDTCGCALPLLKTIEEFPPIEYSLYTSTAFNGLFFTIRKLFCCNDHENMIEVLVTLDLLEDYLAPFDYDKLLKNLQD